MIFNGSLNRIYLFFIFILTTLQLISCSSIYCVERRMEIASSLVDSKDFNRAISELRSAIVIAKRNYGDNDIRVYKAMLRLAGALCVTEQLDEAKHIIASLISATEKHEPRLNTIYSESLLLIGSIDNMSGDVDSAIRCLNKSLLNMPRRLDNDSLVSVANVYKMLSTISLERGEIEKAMEYVSQIGKLARQHPSVSKLSHNYWLELANVKLESGKYVEAETILRSVSNDYKVGTSMSKLVRSNMYLTRSLEAQGKIKEARRIVLNTIDAIGKKKKSDSGLYIEPLIYLAKLENDLKKNRKAKEHLERAKYLAIRTYGINNSRISGIDNGLAAISYDNGNKKNARDILLRAKERIENGIGARSIKLIPILDNLSNVQRLVGDYSSALASLKQLLAIQKKIFVKDHESIMDTNGKIEWTMKRIRER